MRYWPKPEPKPELRVGMNALKHVLRYGSPQVQFGNILRDLKRVAAESAVRLKRQKVAKLAWFAVQKLSEEQEEEANVVTESADSFKINEDAKKAKC